jgi:hypothetical protein
MLLVNRQNEEYVQFRALIDWHNWTVGVEAHVNGMLATPSDQLGEYRKVMVCVGPLIVFWQWPR